MQSIKKESNDIVRFREEPKKLSESERKSKNKKKKDHKKHAKTSKKDVQKSDKNKRKNDNPPIAKRQVKKKKTDAYEAFKRASC